MLGLGKPADARADAQAALTLADNDANRAEAQRLLEGAGPAEAAAAARPAPAAAPPMYPRGARCGCSVNIRRGIPSAGSTSLSASIPGALLASYRRDDGANTCVRGPVASCRDARQTRTSSTWRASPETTALAPSCCLLSKPSAPRRLRRRAALPAFLYERGRGVATNAAIAASFYNQACEAGDPAWDA